MRRLVVFTLLALALVVPAVALAVVDGADDGSLSIRNGTGKMLLSPFNGTTIGRIAHGRVVVTDPLFGDGAGVDFWGCEKRDDKSDVTIVCSGDNIRFRAVGGKYRIFVRGVGIYLSAVGHGSVLIDGRGDDPSVNYDGVFSLNDGSYRSLPNAPQTYTLAAPAGG
jgi:hypothetical protein